MTTQKRIHVVGSAREKDVDQSGVPTACRGSITAAGTLQRSLRVDGDRCLHTFGGSTD